jgi:hypothetical protein
MSRGVVLVASNNSKIDYILQALYSATRIKEYLNIPVSLITETPEILEQQYSDRSHFFDKIIPITPVNDYTMRTYRDSKHGSIDLKFKNTLRSRVYDLSPYDETLVLDTDVIVSNNRYLKCFEQKHDLLMYKSCVDVNSYRNIKEFEKINDQGVEFYWATCMFFRKTPANLIFFNLVQHVHENYQHYRRMYYINSGIFRNDFVFSIAIHIMNGFTCGDFVKPLPGNLYYSTDRDELLNIEEEKLILLLEEKNENEKSIVSLNSCNVHVMNKFSIERMLTHDC